LNAVEIKNVTKTFGSTRAVDDLSLSVPEGSVYGFIGPNGSGKTTTLRMAMNIFYPDTGNIRMFGEALHDSSTDHIGYLPEERGLYKKMQVGDLLKFYGELKNAKDLDSEIQQWLERLDLSEWKNRKIETLSKGMSQKVQFIAAVVARPRLLILDEPFSGLDPVNADVLRNAILDIRKTGTTVIFSTHDMNVAERMCDFIFMIFKGRKVLDGTLSDIQKRYGSDTLRVRCENTKGALRALPGVERVSDFGQVQELRLQTGQDPQEVVQSLVATTRVQSFEITTPSLHDIFVRIAGPEAQEVQNA